MEDLGTTQQLTDRERRRLLRPIQPFPDDNDQRGLRHHRQHFVADDADPTQASNTQERIDPRRMGRNNSGLSEKDHSDVICILHPTTSQSMRIVEDTARLRPQFILQYDDEDDQTEDPSQAETIVPTQNSQASKGPKDLALRFSSHVNDPTVGFCFGRNRNKCDINLDPAGSNKRISNVHFRIFYSPSGVLMLEDLSTNGTIVDSTSLGGKNKPNSNPTTRMVSHGSIIQILSTVDEELIKFIVRIPPRGPFEEEWKARFLQYMRHVAVAQEKMQRYKDMRMHEIGVRRVMAAPFAGPPNDRALPPPMVPSSGRMMKWNGDGRYNEVALLGKGAFAVVYQIATVSTGDLYAAKELEKKRFMRGGQLDHKLDSEMQIMKGLDHPHIVRYVECAETEQHLYIIMELVPGGDMQGYMAAHKFLPEEMGKEMSKQILDALAYLHARSITHRDIKPDNILISTIDPFITKLTDFGLSKVVKNNETFLKTFCGTLLYCAPEVFPHFEVRRGQKRSHKPGERRSYSQLVDIWSYAAVLWFCLSGQPPFEGVMDPQGRAMLERIMTTSLDTTPLLVRGISRECIDLLVHMLDVDPTTRPTELDCLNHIWINPDGNAEFEISQAGLEVIEEGVEHELDASSLHIQDQARLQGQDSDSSFGDADRSHLAKRAKTDNEIERNARHLPRQGATLQSEGGSVDADKTGWQTVPLMIDTNARTQADTTQEGHKPKLFGEISQAALQSSGLLGDGPGPRSAGPFVANSSSPMYEELEVRMPQSSGDSKDEQNGNGRWASASLSLGGAEDMVRDLHMTSPEQSVAAPHTPNGSHKESFGSAKQNQTPPQITASNDPDPTPKAQYDRRIRLPVAASMWYDAYDSSTHNVEYAIEKSGIDFNDPEIVAKYDAGALPPEIDANLKSLRQSYQEAHEAREKASFEESMLQKSFEQEQNGSAAKQSTDYGSLPSNMDDIASNGHQLAENMTAEFARPLPRLGRLTSDSKSFTDAVVPLSSLKTSYGRHPACTVVHHRSDDTRIPKVAFQITFEVDDQKRSQTSDNADKRTDEEILNSPDIDKLQAYIRTWSSKGIRINGVPLSAGDDKTFCYGKLFDGDEVCISFHPDGSRLTFSASIVHGKSKVKRSQPGFEVLKRLKTAS